MSEIGGKRPSPGAASEPGPHEWRPIETAPKDGEPFLACQWDTAREGWAIGVVLYEEALGEIVDPVSDRPKRPTHWMPLPEPPRG